MVAIKSLKMPKGCYVCPIKSPCLEEVYYSSTRPDSCPLIEIPDLQSTCNEVATDCKGDVSRQAVKHLDLFTKTYCRDKSVTNDLAFRCKQCDFEMPNGKCLVKTMARKLCPDYKNFGSMGDL